MGHVTVVGGARATKPSTGVLASDLPVGSVVKLMESGTAVEYLVVNQGIPSNSDLYDASCDGTWLLRKDIHSERQWNSVNVNKYGSSSINTWLNGDYFSSLGTAEQATIKQVKIPYRDGGMDQSGAYGLLCKIFLLSGYEVGWTTRDNSDFPVDGAKLSYFDPRTSSFADYKRIANLNGSATAWWIRSPLIYNTTSAVWIVNSNGSYNGNNANSSNGIRPALVLPSTAKFNATTMLLKG